nr:immunoglobulin heavy chain junction region [Macaca mulatta]MOY26919.1 immunoglobulin heavy chain junction region [Macaca mulatta]
CACTVGRSLFDYW